MAFKGKMESGGSAPWTDCIEEPKSPIKIFVLHNDIAQFINSAGEFFGYSTKCSSPVSAKKSLQNCRAALMAAVKRINMVLDD